MKHLLLAVLLIAGSAFATPPTTITSTNLSETATTLDATAVDGTNGNQVVNTVGDLFVVIHNTDGSNSCTTTVVAQGTSVKVPGYGTMTKANLTIATAAGVTKAVGPLPASAWADGNGYTQFTFSGTGCTNTKINVLTARP